MKKKQRLDRETSKPPISLRAQEAVDEAYQLIQESNPEAAIELLLPLAEKYPRNAELQYLMGFAYAQVGNFWKAAIYLPKAAELSSDPEHWYQAGIVYLNLNLRALMMHALR